MQRRDHARAPGEPGRRHRDDPAPRQDVAAAMLALQPERRESGGRRAPGADTDGDPGKTERPEGAAQVTLAGIGTIQVQSVQLPHAHRRYGVGLPRTQEGEARRRRADLHVAGGTSLQRPPPGVGGRQGDQRPGRPPRRTPPGALERHRLELPVLQDRRWGDQDLDARGRVHRVRDPAGRGAPCRAAGAGK